ncbi:hypothetical protein AHAS_Ahas03G0320000 [Arachis hypogaea]
MSNFTVPVFHHGGRLGKDSQAAAQVKDSSSSSSSDEDDGSSKDKAYNPPSDVYDKSSDTDSDKEIMKLKTHTNKKAADEKDDCNNGKGGADGKATRNVNTDKKANSRKYAGKRKKHTWPNFSHSGKGNAQPDSRQDKSRSSHTKDFEPIIEEVDFEEEKEYVYESEAFVSPVPSYDEGGNKHQWPEHKIGYGYGEVYFELGMEFDIMAQFKECLKDYFVYEGKECRYIRNEPKRIRATCAESICYICIIIFRQRQKSIRKRCQK